MARRGIEDWMVALEGPCLREDLRVDWGLTEWSSGETLYFEHPGSPERRGRIIRDGGAFEVAYEVRIAHSRLDSEGAQAVLERRLSGLLDDGATLDEADTIRGHRDIWGAVLEALDIVDTGRDGYVLDRLGIAFFREHLQLADALQELTFGLHRRDWWGRKDLPAFPCYPGPGMGLLFLDRHGRIIHVLLEDRGSLDRTLRDRFSSKDRDFSDVRGVVETFWILPLRSSVAWRWGRYIESWLENHANQYLMDPYDLDPDDDGDW